PGLLEPEYQLHETMRAAALRVIDDAEVIAYLHPAAEAPAPPLIDVAQLGRPPGAPIITVFTKADLAAAPTPPGGIEVSALTGAGLNVAGGAVGQHSPQGQ